MPNSKVVVSRKMKYTILDRLSLSRVSKLASSSCSDLYDSSPVSFLTKLALKDSMIGLKVSGRKATAARKAAPDMIRVTQSTHRQPIQSTIQPLAIGAIVGPARLVSELD